MLMWIQFETRLWRMYILIKLNELSSCLQRPWSHPSIPAGSGGQAKHNKLRPNYRLNLFMTVHFSKTKQCECSHFNCNTATWGISQETVSGFAATDCKAKNPPPGGTPQQTLPQSACVRKKSKPSLDTLIWVFLLLNVDSQQAAVCKREPKQAKKKKINKWERKLTACTSEARMAMETHRSSSL